MSLGLDDDEREKEADHGPFEGVEKKLVIDFTGKGSLRDIERSRFDVIFSNAVCSALSCTSNDDFDAFVLSESSCFVYDRRIVLKTCGTTEPIGAVPAILAEAHKQGLAADSTLYCHMDLLFPEAQSPSYRSFAAERALLEKHFPASKPACLSLASPGNSAWHVYTDGNPTHDCLELLMYDLSRDRMQHFFQQKHKASLSAQSQSGDGLQPPRSNFERRKKSEEAMPNPARRLDARIGIAKLATDGAVWDSFLFEPCGYSSNAILGGTYWTIHVTPEEESSYVSFEVSPRPANVAATLHKVLEFFGPERFSVVLTGTGDVASLGEMGGFVNEGSVCEEAAGYSTWVGHFATPEHIAARPPPEPPATLPSTRAAFPDLVKPAPTSLSGMSGSDPLRWTGGFASLDRTAAAQKWIKHQPEEDMKHSDEELKTRAWQIKLTAAEQQLRAQKLIEAMSDSVDRDNADWEAHSSTEEDELALRYEPGTRDSMDESLLAGSAVKRDARVMKVVG